MRFLSIIVLFLSLAQFAYADLALPDPVGRVVWVKGTLRAVMPNQEERILQKASVIYTQDTLITDEISTAQIVYTDNSLMTFNQSTTFKIDKYNYQPKDKSVASYISTLVTGGFRTITGLIAKQNPDSYRVNTPVATIGVRGTDYQVSFINGSLAMTYFKGQPCLTNANGVTCLGGDRLNAVVNSYNAVPIISSKVSTQLVNKLEVKPAEIQPFVPPPSLTAPAAGKPITSFCISQ